MTTSIGGPSVDPFDYSLLNGINRAEQRASQWGFVPDRSVMTDLARAALRQHESEPPQVIEYLAEIVGISVAVRTTLGVESPDVVLAEFGIIERLREFIFDNFGR